MLKNHVGAVRLTTGRLLLLLAIAAVPMAVAFGAHPRTTGDGSKPAENGTTEKRNSQAAAGGALQPPDAQPPERRTPLAEAVASLNKKADEYLSVVSFRWAKSPAPLVVDEVIRAIHEWKWDKVRDEKARQICLRIAETKSLPPSATLRFSPQWRHDGGEYEDLVWWIDLDVMTSANRGYTLRIREEKLDRRLAVRPSDGYHWVVDPHFLEPPFVGGYSAGGVVFSIDTDTKGSLTATAAWDPGGISRRIGEHLGLVRFVAFDEKANRHLLTWRDTGAHTGTATDSDGTHSGVFMRRFRLDANALPAAKVRYLGIEGKDSAPQTRPLQIPGGATITFPPGGAEHFEEVKQLIAQKKYKFLRTIEMPPGRKQYVYRFTCADGYQMNMNFAMRLEDVASWEDYLQKRDKQGGQR